MSEEVLEKSEEIPSICLNDCTRFNEKTMKCKKNLTPKQRLFGEFYCNRQIIKNT